MNYYYITLGSLALNAIALFCLFSPNIIMLLHKRWFDWRGKELPKSVTEMITKPIIINYYPDKSEFLIRSEFDKVEVGDLIHRFTSCEPYSKGVYSYNGTRKVISNDTENKILILQELNPKGTSTSLIHYSGKEHHGMTEEGRTLRGSESFECYYYEKYTKTYK
jgi:hypothetical protein